MADAKRSFVGLRDLTDAGKLAEKRKSADALRHVLKREWSLNRAFYNGQQWAFWHAALNRVENLPLDGGQSWKVRLVDNQIKPGLLHYTAQLTKNRPVTVADPDSGSDQDIKAAQMAESLFDYLWDELLLNQKSQAAIIEAGLSGGFWKITWDALAGKPMTFTMGPDGNPIVDDEMASAFIDQFAQELMQTGHDPSIAEKLAKQTVYLGDIRVEVMNAENVILDPNVTRFEDCQWAICRHLLDPDEVNARWGRKVSPTAIPDMDQPYSLASSNKREPTLVEVFIMYIRPCPALQKGRYVVWVEQQADGPGGDVLQDMAWPYPFTELPLVKFPGIPRPGSAYDDSIVTDARPLQKDLNKTLSQIVESKNLTVRPQMLAPVGSLRTKLTTRPGDVVEFNPVMNLIPQWREMPNLPSYVFELVQDHRRVIAEKFNKLPSARDQLPARMDSGSGMESILETISDQLTPIITKLEDAIARAGHLFAAYAQEYYTEPRLLKIRGAGGSVQVKKFEAADIAGGFTFRPRYGTGLPRTRAGKHAAIMEMLQAGLIDERTALKHLDLSDVRGVEAKIARDEDMALREHDKMLRGEPLNQMAIQDAQQQLQQFQQQAAQTVQQIQSGQQLDLDGDGQPDDPQQIIQQLQQQFQQLQQDLQDAPWKPLEWEDVFSHVPTHMDKMKTPEFEAYPMDIQRNFRKHLELSFQMMQQQMWMKADPKQLPKVNITAKATTSAKVLAKILEAQGIPTDPNEVAEPPLETAVLDFVDKPDAENTGNSQMDQMATQLEMMQAQDAHELSQAKAAQAMALAQAQAAGARNKESQQLDNADQQQAASDAQQAQAIQQAQELHDQKLRHAEELHKHKLAAAKRPPSQAKK